MAFPALPFQLWRSSLEAAILGCSSNVTWKAAALIISRNRGRRFCHRCQEAEVQHRPHNPPHLCILQKAEPPRSLLSPNNVDVPWAMPLRLNVRWPSVKSRCIRRTLLPTVHTMLRDYNPSSSVFDPPIIAASKLIRKGNHLENCHETTST